jgi:hypothetical protein
MQPAFHELGNAEALDALADQMMVLPGSPHSEGCRKGADAVKVAFVGASASDCAEQHDDGPLVANRRCAAAIDSGRPT